MAKNKKIEGEVTLGEASRAETKKFLEGGEASSVKFDRTPLRPLGKAQTRRARLSDAVRRRLRKP